MALLNWIKQQPASESDAPLAVPCRTGAVAAKISVFHALEEAPESSALENSPAPASQPAAVHADTLDERRILYVLETPENAPAVRKMFDTGAEDWMVVIAGGHAEAGALLQEQPFDAVICDSPSPQDCNEFLSWVATTPSNAHGFVVCDPADKAFLKNWKGNPPRLIARGTDFSLFADTLKCAFGLDTWLSSAPVRALLVHMRKLPTLPTLYARITTELSAEDPSIDAVAEIISEDPVMTAKILQFANSGYLGLSSRLTSARDAVLVLGTQRTRGIVLLASMFSRFEDTRCPGFSLPEFANHSINVARFAAQIAKAETQDHKLADTAFTAGLVHEIGRLLMAANLPDSYHQILSIATDMNQTLVQTEREVYGTDHAEFGACLLATWSQTPAIVDAVGLHQNPLRAGDREFSLLTALHVANVLDQKPGKGAVSALDLPYLESIGALKRFEEWRELCYSDR